MAPVRRNPGQPNQHITIVGSQCEVPRVSLTSRGRSASVVT